MKKSLFQYPLRTFLALAALSTLNLATYGQTSSSPIVPAAPATGTTSGAAAIPAPGDDNPVPSAAVANPAGAAAGTAGAITTNPAAGTPATTGAATSNPPAPVAAIQADPNADPAAITPAKPDTEMQAVLDAHAALDPKPIETLTAKEARKQPTIADAVKAVLKKKGEKTAPEPVGDVDDRNISEGDSNVKIRVYTPKGEGPLPVIVYYHGGGFVIADIDVYDSTPRALANAVGAVVVSAEYRHGPEHKYPAAHEDAFNAYQWVLKNAAKIKGDPARIAVAGESAGGNLAAHVSIMARDKQVQLPVHQLLVYPVTDGQMDTPSYLENATAKPLNAAMMKWFFENYTKPEDAQDPKLVVMNADLKGLPSATIITAQIDPLRSEGEAFGKKLEAAGVKVNHKNFEGVAHEFFGAGAVIPKAKEAVAVAAEDLKTAFGAAREAKKVPAAATEAAPPSPTEKPPKTVRDKTVPVE